MDDATAIIAEGIFYFIFILYQFIVIYVLDISQDYLQGASHTMVEFFEEGLMIIIQT